MAEQLDVFKKSFDSINKRSDAALLEMQKAERLIGQSSAVVKEGVKEIGLRVQELKDRGDTGTTIADFLGDKEVKKMYDSAVGLLKPIEAECKRMVGVKASIRKIIDDYVKLKADMAAEIAQRKKATSTKLGVGNKSLPDMEKLLVTVRKHEEVRNSFSTVMFFEPEVFADHKREFDNGIKAQISSTKEVKLTALQSAMQEQAMNTRVLIRNYNRATTAMETVIAECANVTAAIGRRDNAALQAAKANVRIPLKELSDMAGQYKAGLADGWIKTRIGESKDKDKILKGANAIISCYDKASAEVKKVGNARIE